MDKLEYFGLVIIIIMILFTINNFINVNKSWDFCHSQGYDSSIDYSKGLGKVLCLSCFNHNCTKEIFNVEENWRGSLKEKEIKNND